MDIFLFVASALIIGCWIYFIIRFLIMVLGISRAVNKGNKEAKIARIQRQDELKKMSVDSLRSILRDDLYLNGLKGTKALKEFFENLEQNNEKEIIKNNNEKNFYGVLVGAEYEKGLKGRPEAVDNASEIWDVIKELSARSQ